MAKAEAKILRVGIIQGGKIIEERLLRRKETVTIGQSPKSTFYVPISRLPRSLTLFEVKGDQYQLSFADGTQGRVSVKDRVVNLAELKQSDMVQRKGSHNLLPLDQKSRGKLVLGDITLLFQFVPPPPVVPKPQLPASAKGGLGQAIMAESAFMFALIASLVIQGGFVALSIIFETPEDKVKKKNRFVQMLAHDVQFQEKEEEEEEKEKEKEDKKDDEKKEEEKEEEKYEPPPIPEPPPPKKVEAKPKKKAEKRAPLAKRKSPADLKKRRRARVQNKTLLKFVTAAGKDGSAGPDTLRQGQAKKMATAFDPGGIAVAKPGEVKGFGGGAKIAGNDRTAKVARMTRKEKGGGRLKVAKVTKKATKKERKVKARIALRKGSKVGGMGTLDKGSVARVFRRRASAFRACYERRLKVNPNLSGKIIITFTIGTVGRITNIKVAKNSTGDSAVGSCIIGKVRGWRFSPPQKGAVTMRFPIVLSKG